VVPRMSAATTIAIASVVNFRGTASFTDSQPSVNWRRIV
jgi:hypothetical protein